MAVHVGQISRRPKSWNRRVQLARHLSQAGFVVIIASVVIRHSLTPESATSTVPSPEAYSPFGGETTLSHADVVYFGALAR